MAHLQARSHRHSGSRSSLPVCIRSSDTVAIPRTGGVLTLFAVAGADEFGDETDYDAASDFANPLAQIEDGVNLEVEKDANTDV